MNVEIISHIGGTKLDKWKYLMAETGLKTTDRPERTVLVWDEDELVASGSRDKNILKQLAVSPTHQGEDLLSKVITELRRDAFEDGYRHLFIYTKPQNKYIFSSLFFYPIAETDKVLVMENNRDGIKSYLDTLPEKTVEKTVGAIVMNCNPFTLGHQYLIEKAAAECDRVYIFVLSEEGDGFSAKDRFEMVKLGTEHLPNVTVLQTGPYLISAATFPTYFLKDRDNADEVLCDIDIEIFLKYFVPRLAITRRYVGTEPLSQMTNTYNEALRKRLSQTGLEFREIERKDFNGTPISASEVRRLIKQGETEHLKNIIPMTTMNYLKSHDFV
ncbi:MAG: [Clostridia bacterium]|nr:[citrate (pro-3S)-lyase] ligase [Clostridia bacterium]